eukprot:TRINITY_DN30410_c0_g1_i1.p1 TRINITY_DN30410_c0_g1~~TRINITY_DN30410_c0_g1_i1.p1  ORF type:complete len:373 (+),score=53.99 TRINITY_DN30410_c0_g1_i1:54-1121(+)
MGNVSCFQGVLGPVPKTPTVGFKVCVCGGAGAIGQPLSLLMALNPRVQELCLYDLSIAVVPPEGVGADLSHIERRCRVRGYALEASQRPAEHLEECLSGCSLVLVAAGVPTKNRDRNDLLKINTNIAKSIVEACAKFCPDAVVGLMVNPMNSVVPAMSRLYEKRGLDPQKICGVSTLDQVRANKFLHEETGAPIESINVPVIGGYSGASSGSTVLPLFSQVAAAARLPVSKRKELVARVQAAREEIASVGRGKAGPHLSEAYAGARFGRAVLEGLAGERTDDVAFVRTPGGFCAFSSARVTFGPDGVEVVHPPGRLAEDEVEMLREVAERLNADVQDGLDYADSTDMSMSPQPMR